MLEEYWFWLLIVFVPELLESGFLHVHASAEHKINSMETP